MGECAPADGCLLRAASHGLDGQCCWGSLLAAATKGMLGKPAVQLLGPLSCSPPAWLALGLRVEGLGCAGVHFPQTCTCPYRPGRRARPHSPGSCIQRHSPCMRHTCCWAQATGLWVVGAGRSLPSGHSAQADADERVPGSEPALQVGRTSAQVLRSQLQLTTQSWPSGAVRELLLLLCMAACSDRPLEPVPDPLRCVWFCIVCDTLTAQARRVDSAPNSCLKGLASRSGDLEAS